MFAYETGSAKSWNKVWVRILLVCCQRYTMPVVFVVLLGGILAGCGGSGGADSSEGSDPVAVNVGITNSSSDAPFFIADEKGYFEEQGIRVEFQSFDAGARMIAPLGSGDLDVGAGAPSAGLYNAVARGVEFKMVADKASTPPGFGYAALLVSRELVESGEFDGFEDLRGLTVAEPGPATATSSTLNEALEKGGLEYGDVRHEYLGFPEHVAAFQNGSIDASMTAEPSLTQAVESGAAVRFAGYDEIYPNQQLAVVLYSGEFAENREVATKFMVAYLKAVRDYNDVTEDGRFKEGAEADEIISIISENTDIEPGVYREITVNGVDPDGQMNVESLSKDLQFFKEENMLESEDVTVDQVLDTTFVRGAVEQLGPYEPGQ
jgi:NitT/TauT family transport system substrate-binding protein